MSNGYLLNISTVWSRYCKPGLLSLTIVQVLWTRIVSCGIKNKIEEGGGGGWCSPASENNHRIAQESVVIFRVDIVSKLANFAEHLKNFTPIWSVGTLLLESLAAHLKWFKSGRVCVGVQWTYCSEPYLHVIIFCHPVSSVGLVTDYGLHGPGSNPGGDEISRPSRPAQGPTQPPVQWVPGFPGGRGGRGVGLTPPSPSREPRS